MPRLLLLILALPLAGCRIIDVTTKDGTQVKIVSVGNDTKAGKVAYKSPDGRSFDIENLDSQARGLETANRALDLANTVAGRAAPLLPTAADVAWAQRWKAARP